MGEFAEENELISVAMQIILHAGDARVKVTEGLQEAKSFDGGSGKGIRIGAQGADRNHPE